MEYKKEITEEGAYWFKRLHLMSKAKLTYFKPLGKPSRSDRLGQREEFLGFDWRTDSRSEMDEIVKDMKENCVFYGPIISPEY